MHGFEGDPRLGGGGNGLLLDNSSEVLRTLGIGRGVINADGVRSRMGAKARLFVAYNHKKNAQRELVQGTLICFKEKNGREEKSKEERENGKRAAAKDGKGEKDAAAAAAAAAANKKSAAGRKRRRNGYEDNEEEEEGGDDDDGGHKE